MQKKSCTKEDFYFISWDFLVNLRFSVCLEDLLRKMVRIGKTLFGGYASTFFFIGSIKSYDGKLQLLLPKEHETFYNAETA